jgi:predicted histidine transporter YuiF (NhaC family)
MNISITAENIIQFSALLVALATIVGLFVGIVRFFDEQKKQREDLTALAQKEQNDLEEATGKQACENASVRKEQAIICYALLACLDGLHQLGANGNVTKAHEALEKHINQSAHE